MPDVHGLTFRSSVVVGIVEEIAWGEWSVDQQEAHAFAVEGVSSIEGALVSRDFEVPLILDGYATQVLRDSAILELERQSGKVGALILRVAGGTVIFNQTENIKLLTIRRGKSGYDATHLHWRNISFLFRQLSSRGRQEVA